MLVSTHFLTPDESGQARPGTERTLTCEQRVGSPNPYEESCVCAPSSLSRCNEMSTELAAIRSIVIRAGKFLPSFHSPAKGSGRHHLAVMSPPAAGRIYRMRQSLGSKKDDTLNKQHKPCQCLVEGRCRLNRDREIL